MDEELQLQEDADRNYEAQVLIFLAAALRKYPSNAVICVTHAAWGYLRATLAPHIEIDAPSQEASASGSELEAEGDAPIVGTRDWVIAELAADGDATCAQVPAERQKVARSLKYRLWLGRYAAQVRAADPENWKAQTARKVFNICNEKNKAMRKLYSRTYHKDSICLLYGIFPIGLLPK